MTTIYLNPGSGPVQNATEEEAWKNIRAFVVDLAAKGVAVADILRCAERDERDGRYEFDLLLNTPQLCEDSEPRTHIAISMPGLPLERVRYLGEPQNIWHYPRLYVDGSSWVWKYAVNVCLPDETRLTK